MTIGKTSEAIADAIRTGNFDGWVYPNGATYYKVMGGYDFSEAYEAFGGSNGTFTVPDITGFFKTNPGAKYAGNAL